MKKSEAQHCAAVEKIAWEEVLSIAKLQLRRIEEAETKYKINKQKQKIASRMNDKKIKQSIGETQGEIKVFV